MTKSAEPSQPKLSTTGFLLGTWRGRIVACNVVMVMIWLYHALRAGGVSFYAMGSRDGVTIAGYYITAILIANLIFCAIGPVAEAWFCEIGRPIGRIAEEVPADRGRKWGRWAGYALFILDLFVAVILGILILVFPNLE